MKRPGFMMNETMSGSHHFVGGAGPAGELPMSFTLEWGPDDMLAFANPFSGDDYGLAQAVGTVTIGGLVEDAPCRGTLEVHYFTEAKIRYRFEFKGPDGKEYRFVGEKRGLRPWNLHRTHTTLYGELTEKKTGKLVSKSVTYFRMKTLPGFLASFRWKKGEETEAA